LPVVPPAARAAEPTYPTAEHAAAAAAFTDLCFLREQARFFDAMLDRRCHYGAGDAASLDEKRTSLAVLAAMLAVAIEKHRSAYLAALASTADGAAGVRAALEQDLAGLRERMEPLLRWAKEQNLHVPEPPRQNNFLKGARETLWFGAAATGEGDEAVDAWKQLGIDFVGVAAGREPVPIPWGDAGPSFLRLGEFVARMAKGRVRVDVGAAGSGALDFSVWNPVVRTRWDEYWRELGERCKRAEGAFAYEILNERYPRPFGAERGDDGRCAVAAFRAYLRETYGSIGALNVAWEAGFRDFDQISGPVRRRSFGAADRDHSRFLETGLARFVRASAAALTKADAERPTRLRLPGPERGEDPYRLGASGVDIVTCPGQFGVPPGGAASFARAAGLARFLGKPLWQDEPIVAGDPPADRNEEAAAINRAVWHALAGGVQVLAVGTLAGTGGATILDGETRSGLIRPAFGRLAVAVSLARKHEGLLRETEPAAAPIGLVEAPSSLLEPRAAALHRDALRACEEWLFAQSWPYAILPEGGLVERTELWERQRVTIVPDGEKPVRWGRLPIVILPACLYLESGAAAALERYLTQGGVIIRIGRAGMLDEVGKPSLLAKTFLARQRLTGRGYVFTFSDVAKEGEALRALLRRLLGAPQVVVTPAERVLSFVRRRGPQVYLFLVNLSASERLEPEVVLRGMGPAVSDVLANAPVPTEQRSPGAAFTTVLEPGGVGIFAFAERPPGAEKPPTPSGAPGR
jgi:hypothetical protein